MQYLYQQIAFFEVGDKEQEIEPLRNHLRITNSSNVKTINNKRAVSHRRILDYKTTIDADGMDYIRRSRYQESLHQYYKAMKEGFYVEAVVIIYDLLHSLCDTIRYPNVNGGWSKSFCFGFYRDPYYDEEVLRQVYAWKLAVQDSVFDQGLRHFGHALAAEHYAKDGYAIFLKLFYTIKKWYDEICELNANYDCDE